MNHDEYNAKYARLRDIVDTLDRDYPSYRLPGSPSLRDCINNHGRRESCDLVKEGLALWEWINNYEYENYESLR